MFGKRSLKGTVYNRDGTRVFCGATVRVTVEGPTLVDETVTTDKRGRFKLRIPGKPGEWRRKQFQVENHDVERHGGEIIQVNDREIILLSPVSVTAPESRAGGFILGQAVDRGGSPVRKASIGASVVYAPDDERLRVHVSPRARADITGFFALHFVDGKEIRGLMLNGDLANVFINGHQLGMFDTVPTGTRDVVVQAPELNVWRILQGGIEANPRPPWQT